MHGCKCKYIKYCELKYYSVFQIEHSTNYATITLDIYTVCEYYFTWLWTRHNQWELCTLTRYSLAVLQWQNIKLWWSSRTKTMNTVLTTFSTNMIKKKKKTLHSYHKEPALDNSCSVITSKFFFFFYRQIEVLAKAHLHIISCEKKGRV